MSAQFPAGIRAAQAVGLTGAAWLAGNIFGYSFVSIPSLLNSHREYQAPIALILKQWRDMYNAGHRQNPPIAAISAAAFGYLAWAVPHSTAGEVLAPTNAAALYSTAAALTAAMVPWTFVAMMQTNRLLLDRAAATWVPTEKSSEDVEGLLGKWSVLNMVRGVFPLVGAVVGSFAA
ncbi:hypothetical protein BDW59DRAFT_57000 [Aspergillus cavernicola]|uniref:DUF1772-domain-containing protein n=1 Tax=Aspergillus cavernicola TaxID=176166 RepID=A0ABR4IHY5_9EURO